MTSDVPRTGLRCDNCKNPDCPMPSHEDGDYCERFEAKWSADIVEVVRCKDCKNQEEDGMWLHCKYHNIYVRDEDYCSNGFRKPEKKKAHNQRNVLAKAIDNIREQFRGRGMIND